MLSHQQPTAISESALQFLVEYRSCLIEVAKSFNEPAIQAALTHPETESSIGRALDGFFDSHKSTIGSPEVILDNPPHRALALRIVADRIVCLALPGHRELAQLSLCFQWRALENAGLLPEEAQQNFEPELAERIERTSVLQIPDPVITATLSSLEGATGLPWRACDTHNSEQRGSDYAGREYLCQISNEGAARALLLTLRDVLPDPKSVRCVWIAEHGVTKLAISVSGDVAEDPRFQQALHLSSSVNSLHRRLELSQFTEHYTRFQHSPSIASELRSQPTPSYESLAFSSEQVSRPHLLAQELSLLLHAHCMEPTSVKGTGYLVFFEHGISQDLAHELLARSVLELNDVEAPEVRRQKAFPWDRRLEIHLPVDTAASVEFRELLRCNREIRESLREIAMQDARLFKPLEAALEDQLAHDQEARMPSAERKAENEALEFDTSLTHALRNYILKQLAVHHPAPSRIAELQTVSASILNRHLREQSLVFLLHNEDARHVFLTEILDPVREELERARLALTPTPTIQSVLHAIDEGFVIAAENYMNALDHAALRKGRFIGEM
ncbi:MAG: hypothetical protein J0M12_08585 [Deltaproteobacteria bacterium]|nr:hypothetical protein [Deltaproteobacteria bacterium]